MLSWVSAPAPPFLCWRSALCPYLVNVTSYLMCLDAPSFHADQKILHLHPFLCAPDLTLRPGDFMSCVLLYGPVNTPVPQACSKAPSRLPGTQGSCDKYLLLKERVTFNILSPIAGRAGRYSSLPSPEASSSCQTTEPSARNLLP